MKISGYIWREDIVDKLWWKHNIEIDEVEEIFANRPSVEKIAKGHYKGEDVYVAFGQTDAGRYLTVIFIYKRNHRALINTARKMTKQERRRYGRRKK